MDMDMFAADVTANHLIVQEQTLVGTLEQHRQTLAIG